MSERERSASKEPLNPENKNAGEGPKQADWRDDKSYERNGNGEYRKDTKELSREGSPREREALSPRSGGSPRHDRDRRDSRSMSGEPREARPRFDRSPGYNRRDSRDDRSQSSRRGAAAENDASFTQLYVAGISRSVRSESLRRFFEQVGEVTDIVIKSKYAFINFKRHEDAVIAIKELDCATFDGYKLTVQQSRPGEARRKRTTGPQPSDVCFHCGRKGHWANECKRSRYERDSRMRRSSSYDRRRSRSDERRYRRGGDMMRRRSRSRSYENRRSRELREGRCFFCQEKGHKRIHCPQYRAGGGRYGGGDGERRDRGERMPWRGGRSGSRSPPPRSRSNERRETYHREYRPRSPADRSGSPPERRGHHASRSPPYRE